MISLIKILILKWTRSYQTLFYLLSKKAVTEEIKMPTLIFGMKKRLIYNEVLTLNIRLPS